MEHTTISLEQAGELIRTIELSGVPSLVRLTSNDENQIKRVMDAGATGVVVPMVKNVEDAKSAVAAIHYPPLGNRGVGLARAQKYGEAFQEYLKWQSDANDGPVVVVQIEHIDAVNNLKNILSVEGVDAFIIGPYDLSCSMGIPGEFIIPQRITNADSYYPYTAGFRWLSKESGLHRNVLARVLRTEGIPVSSGLPRLMSDNPIFQNQLAYGKHSCPFDCHLYKRRGLYAVPDLPNATRLQEEEYIGFFQIGWPNTKNDIDDIIKGIHKVLKNKKRLAQEPVHSTSNFISGR